MINKINKINKITATTQDKTIHFLLLCRVVP